MALRNHIIYLTNLNIYSQNFHQEIFQNSRTASNIIEQRALLSSIIFFILKTSSNSVTYSKILKQWFEIFIISLLFIAWRISSELYVADYIGINFLYASTVDIPFLPLATTRCSFEIGDRGVRISPIPFANAIPPLIKKGTSAPNSTAMLFSSS